MMGGTDGGRRMPINVLVPPTGGGGIAGTGGANPCGTGIGGGARPGTVVIGLGRSGMVVAGMLGGAIAIIGAGPATGRSGRTNSVVAISLAGSVPSDAITSPVSSRGSIAVDRFSDTMPDSCPSLSIAR